MRRPCMVTRESPQLDRVHTAWKAKHSQKKGERPDGYWINGKKIKRCCAYTHVKYAIYNTD